MLLGSPVPSQCTPSGVRCQRSYGLHAHSRTSTGFIGGTGVGGGVQPAAASTASSAWASAWQWLPQGSKDCSCSRPSSRTVDCPRQKHSIRYSSARHDHDDTDAAPVEVHAKPRSMVSGGTAVEGWGDNGGGGSNDSGVHSLVDLVKLLQASENPLWELVRFEVWRVERGPSRHTTEASVANSFRKTAYMW